ncbi:heme-binding protein [Mycolicibacterium sp.]|jgi:hemophore-related protein|uniref:heme-binding protein n=1 Tax=Mycolicibacterium sp. TaxID=2320850 RepID=UPI0028AB99BC|nr:heme-binding protein [Mycolicibacterium sp.]
MTLTTLLTRTAVPMIAAGAAVMVLAAPALADPAPVVPGCTVADITGVETGVAAAMTAYLFTHPDVNNFLSGLQGQSKEAIKAQAQDYFAANPQIKSELDAIRAPGTDLRNRCNIPATAVILGVL